jgi:hypothetical protein
MSINLVADRLTVDCQPWKHCRWRNTGPECQVFFTPLNQRTLDEAPMANKVIGETICRLVPTLEIIKKSRPVDNIKAKN